VYAEDTAQGLVLLEDLGDATLAKWLERRPADRETLYTRAVRDLARAQNELASLPSGCVISGRTFDAELLRWEIEHFREWVLDARGKPLARADEERFHALADGLARRVASLPSGFVHRDYQSRNLMVVPSGASTRLVWIDFQDACLGPRVYDLVALFNDSYQSFDRTFVEARLADYANAAALPHSRSDAFGRADLLREFDLVTVQRKLKDAGRFVFIERCKGNDAFLRFVPKTLQKAAHALERLAPNDPEMGELLAILRRTLGDELGS
jgi:aminoglycoside/choline kinase family phosphotransferase